MLVGTTKEIKSRERRGVVGRSADARMSIIEAEYEFSCGVLRTSTHALNNAKLRYALALANKRWLQALRDDPRSPNSLNGVPSGVTHQEVASDLHFTDHDSQPLREA